MSYDVKRGVKIGLAAGGVAYFGSALVNKTVEALPFTASEGVKPVAIAAVSAVAADAIVQYFL